MSLQVTSDSSYPSVSITEHIPNINLSDGPVTEIVTDAKQSLNTNDNEKKALNNPEKQLQSEISKANSHLKFRGTRCEFKYYDDINRVAIKVLDNETNEIVKEIPPEEAIEIIQKLWEFAGLFYDEKR